MRLLSTALIAGHAAILIGHDLAHEGLGIHLVPWQTVYAYSLIVGAPLLAAGLLWTAWERWSYKVMCGLMLAAAAFGIYHHYLVISHDHVDHLPAGDEQGLFRSTAALMAVFEIGCALLGAYAYLRMNAVPNNDAAAAAADR